jgi:rhodanese-related sulfurtransferase
MKKIAFALIIGSLLVASAAFGNDFIPITAEQAFDAQVMQIDPISKKQDKVAIVDIRTAAEYYWVGASAKVDMIVTADGKEIKPYLGKVIFDRKNDELLYIVKDKKDTKTKSLTPDQVQEIFTDPISINIPFENWNDEFTKTVPNTKFKKEIESLAAKYDVLILMCRSGKRTSKCDFDKSLFKAVYEVDQPGGKNGRGGFQGSSYEEAFNGYRGFPGRNTVEGENNSVSWSDAGLPVHIGWKHKI